MSEARTGKRFPLELPIKIHRAEESSEHSGITGNLSAAGVYIRADANLEIGSNVEFEISLPPEVTGAKEPVMVKCIGRVVRRDEPTAEARLRRRTVWRVSLIPTISFVTSNIEVLTRC